MKVFNGVGGKNRWLLLLYIGWAACIAPSLIASGSNDYVTTYSISTLAGFKEKSVDGLGTSARFRSPSGMAFGPSGVLYVVDAGIVRKIQPDGTVTTLSLNPGDSFTASGLICIDSAENLFLNSGTEIKKISPAGAVTTFPTNLQISGMAVDQNDNVFISEYFGSISKIAPDGQITTVIAASYDQWPRGIMNSILPSPDFLEAPAGLAFNSAGTLFVADQNNSVVRTISSNGQLTIVAGAIGSSTQVAGDKNTARFVYPSLLTSDIHGNVYVIDRWDWVRKIDSAGAITNVYIPSDSNGGDETLRGLAVDNTGNLYLSTFYSTILKITPAGVSTVFAGSTSAGAADGAADQAHFNAPGDVAVGPGNTIYVCDVGNSTIRKIQPNNVVSTFAGIAGLSGSANGAQGTFKQLSGIAVDANNNVYVADRGNETIRSISPAGVVSTIAGEAGVPGGSDGLGQLAHFSRLAGLALAPDGDLYIADENRLRKMAPDGTVTTVAGQLGVAGHSDGPGTTAQFSLISGLAIDSNGIVYIADPYNFRIRKLTADGMVQTIARTDAIGLAIDPNGNLFATTGNSLQMITSDGQATVVAGLLSGFNSDPDGAGSDAGLNQPSGLAVDSSGALYIADTGNNLIRKAVLTHFQLPPPTVPEILNFPSGVAVDEGAPLALTVAASGVNDQYQWTLNGTPISGATGATYSVASSDAIMGGLYNVVVSNAQGTDSATFPVTINWSRLINVSARAVVKSGEQVQIGGFVISGPAPKQVLIRANGPALGNYNISNFLSRPMIELRRADDNSTIIASNDGWGNSPNELHYPLATAMLKIGASSWPFYSNDAAVLVTLAPGAYTAVVSDKNGASGVSLLEVFDLDNAPATPKFVNLSCRSYVDVGDQVQIAGFVIAGTRPKKVIIRANGPALGNYNVSGYLSDPQLTLQTVDGHFIQSNDDWDIALKPEFAALGIDNWPSGSKDAAIEISLPPGVYTAVVSGAGNSAGVALVEVFEAKEQ